MAWSARNPMSHPRSGASPHSAGADDEDGEPVDVEELAAPHIGEAPDGHHGGDEDEKVAQTHPGDSADGGMECALEGR